MGALIESQKLLLTHLNQPANARLTAFVGSVLAEAKAFRETLDTSKNPRLELALLHVVLEFGGHGAETGLRDLLSEVVIVAIGHQQRMHSRGVFGHDRPPGCIVAGNGLLDQRLGVF